MQRYSFNCTPFSAVSLNMYIAGSYFVLNCHWQSRQHSEDFSRVYDPRYSPGPTKYTYRSVFFFSSYLVSIMSDESDLNCFKGQILNKEIERAKVLYWRKHEEFLRLISQQPKPSYSNLPGDELGTSLIPEDVRGADDRLGALRAKGNGDCLFNSISILLFGDENQSHLLRLLVAWELYFNRLFYADHDAFNDIITSERDFFPDVLFTVALTRQGDKKFSDTGNREETIKEEAFVACEVRAWSSLVHIMAMSSVLCRPIVSMYPSVQFKYRCLVNRWKTYKRQN